jgi:rsbT co-antagonist protein RsbR
MRGDAKTKGPMNPQNAVIDQLLNSRHEQLLSQWIADVKASAPMGAIASNAAAEAAALVDALRAGVRADGDFARLDDAEWGALREVLEKLSRSRAAQGATAGETSHFVLAFKKPVFAELQQSLAADPKGLLDAVWSASALVDQMAQWTATTYQTTREEIIMRQQQELLELSTPVVKLWEGVLAVPMIGTLDSSRTQLVMESLLQRIVETGSELAIIDITGVPTVDTLVAQHLLKTVAAIRLMGADCIISGIRPQIAQTIVHLGIDLQGIITKASLADALSLAMKKLGYAVTRKV